MTEFFRTWLLGITAAALFAAVAEALFPNGTMKRIGKLVCGLVLILAVTKPIASLDLERLSETMTEYRAESGSYGSALDRANDRLVKVIIEEKSGAYIEEKADALGIACSATVQTRTGEGNYPYPYEAVIKGTLTQRQKKLLSELVERDLAIPQARLAFHTEDGSQ